ncbi:hypothetical protein ACTNRH_003068 [Vibrio vulnificus]|nr:hypothetical protein [Vibrio vulnificus]
MAFAPDEKDPNENRTKPIAARLFEPLPHFIEYILLRSYGKRQNSERNSLEENNLWEGARRNM